MSLSQAQALDNINQYNDAHSKDVPKQAFRNNVKHSKYIFRNGKVANFVDGVYVTTVEWEVEELMKEVKARHPHIHLMDGKDIPQTADEAREALRAKIIAEHEATKARTMNKDNDAGNTDITKLVPGNTRSIGDVAGESTSAASEGGAKPAVVVTPKVTASK